MTNANLVVQLVGLLLSKHLCVMPQDQGRDLRSQAPQEDHDTQELTPQNNMMVELVMIVRWCCNLIVEEYNQLCQSQT